jgi:hypothetical protein
MDRAGIEPAASSMPRKRSSPDLSARSYSICRHQIKELVLHAKTGSIQDRYAADFRMTEKIPVNTVPDFAPHPAPGHIPSGGFLRFHPGKRADDPFTGFG